MILLITTPASNAGMMRTTRLSPERMFSNNSDTIGTRPDNGMLSLGVSYRFGQGEAAPVVAPAPAPAPEVQTKHFTLKSDVLFNFNKATLKPEGQAALDQLSTPGKRLKSAHCSLFQ